MSEISDKMAAAQRLRAEYDRLGRHIVMASANRDDKQVQTLTLRRALIPLCLLEMLVDVALETQRMLEMQPPGAAREQTLAGIRDVACRFETAYLMAECSPANALAEVGACMPLLRVLVGRL